MVSALHEGFEQGQQTLVTGGTWKLSGAIIDGNCGGGANASRLALCFFGGSFLQTGQPLHFQGGERLQFYLRAGNFDDFERNYRHGCGGVTEAGQVMILEYSKDNGVTHHEMRRFDLAGFGDNWVDCEERVPRELQGEMLLRWRFEGTGNHFYYLDEIRLRHGPMGLGGPDEAGLLGMEEDPYLVTAGQDQITGVATLSVKESVASQAHGGDEMEEEYSVLTPGHTTLKPDL